MNELCIDPSTSLRNSVRGIRNAWTLTPSAFSDIVPPLDLPVVDGHEHEIDVGLRPDRVVRQAAAQEDGEHAAVLLQLCHERVECSGKRAVDGVVGHATPASRIASVAESAARQVIPSPRPDAAYRQYVHGLASLPRRAAWPTARRPAGSSGAPRASRNSTMSGQIVARRPGERRGAVLLVLRGDVRARVEQDRRALGAMRARAAAAVAAAEVVERRRALPVGQVRDPCRPTRAACAGYPDPRADTNGSRSRLAGTRAPACEQPHDQILLAARRRHREHTAASRVRLARIGGHAPDDLVILVEPDQVVAIQLAAAREQQLRAAPASSPPTSRCRTN